MLITSAFADGTELLEKAEAAFKQGNEFLKTEPDKAELFYRKAADYYSSIIDSGVKNAELYYNLGNTYYRLHETGNAVLNYRKALLYNTGDSRIKYNLESARSLQKNEFQVIPENEVMRILFFWHYIIPFLWKIIILISANLVFWTALVLKLFGRKTAGTAVIAFIAGAVLAVSAAVDYNNSHVLHGVVTSDSTIGRLGDSRSYEPAFDTALYEGVEFTVMQRRVGWLLAELPNGQQAWLEESDCGIVEE